MSHPKRLQTHRWGRSLGKFQKFVHRVRNELALFGELSSRRRDISPTANTPAKTWNMLNTHFHTGLWSLVGFRTHLASCVQLLWCSCKLYVFPIVFCKFYMGFTTNKWGLSCKQIQAKLRWRHRTFLCKILGMGQFLFFWPHFKTSDVSSWLYKAFHAEYNSAVTMINAFTRRRRFIRIKL